jgi:hypothetical protein
MYKVGTCLNLNERGQNEVALLKIIICRISVMSRLLCSLFTLSRNTVVFLSNGNKFESENFLLPVRSEIVFSSYIYRQVNYIGFLI